MFRSLTVLPKNPVNIPQVVVACCYVTMVFTVNVSSYDESLLRIFFRLTLLSKGTVIISKFVATCCYVTMIFTRKCFFS